MKQQKECAIVQDLLVLYEDDVCSIETKQMVEEHIAECSQCREIYGATIKNLPEIQDDSEEEEQFITFAKKMKRRMTVLPIIIIGLILIMVLLGDYLWTSHFKPWVCAVPANEVEVTEVYRLKTGDIYCTLKTKNPFDHLTMDGIQWDGGTSKKVKDAYYSLHFQYGFPWEKTENNTDSSQSDGTLSYIFPVSGTDSVFSYQCVSIFYYGDSEVDRLNIWEEGQEIEDAPEDIQQKAAMEYLNSKDYKKAKKQGATAEMIMEMLEDNAQSDEQDYSFSFPIEIRH